jgi:membrane-anchored glycerophosphoryl diester phosphodiesterase (GDPDase)
MSGNLNSPNPIQPLSVGSVVSAGIRLYRSHLKKYFLIALKAYAWLLVPIYGWVKFYALSALISRLAFGELVNQPESVSSGKRFVNSRLWEFFVNMILMLAISIGITLGFLITGGLLIGIPTALLGGLQDANPANTGIIILITLLVMIIVFTGIIWIGTRFYLVDVPLAIEDDVNGSSTINRSWELTKGNIFRILLISLIGFLITIPIQFIIQIITTIIQLILTTLLKEDILSSSIISFMLTFGLSFVGGALILPFWQTVKAVVYYDLRSRREGLGLRLRDHDI